MPPVRHKRFSYSWLLFALVIGLQIGFTEIAQAATTVIKPTAMNGWVFINEGATGSGSFVYGPDTPPLNDGSLQLVVDATGRHLLGTYAYSNIPLTDLSKLEYSTYVPVGTAASLATTLSFNIDYDITDGDTTTWQGRLTFEPYHAFTVVQGTWQTWDALAGEWWASNTTYGGACPQGNPCTWAQVLATYPNAGIRLNDSLLMFRAGGPWTGGFTGNVDAFTIGINGVEDTYDFEPEVQCTTVCYVNDATGNDAFGGVTPAQPKKTIAAAVAQVSAGGEVIVAPGTYLQTAMIVINKPLTLTGPQANVDPRPSASTTRTAGDPATEAIITGGGSLPILLRIAADDVTINGFELTAVTGDLIDSLEAAPVKNRPTVQYNIIHQVGDEGIQLRNISDGLVEYNHVYDTKGDAINLCCSTTNSTIQHNEAHDIDSDNGAIYIYSSTLINIIDNLVYDVTLNDGIKLGTKSGGDATKSGGVISNNIIYNTAQDGISVYMSDVVVEDNEVYGSSSGNGAIYVTFNVDNVKLLRNHIHDNNTTGIRIGNATLYPTLVEVNENCIVGNNLGLYYNVSGNGVLNAQANWWGAANGPGPIGPGSGDGLGTNGTLSDIDFSAFKSGPIPGVCGCAAPGSVVNTTTGKGFCTIQSAIDAADTVDGHTLTIAAGTYQENVVLNKNLTLSGAGKADTILQGSSCSVAGIAFSGSRSNVTIQDLTVTGFQDGIQMFTGPLNNIVIEDVDASDNCRHGIWSQAFGIDGLRLTRVTASNNNAPPLATAFGRGVWIINGEKANITIEDGVFNNNRLVGIDVSDGNVSGLTITGNEVVGNGDSGIGVLGAQGPGAALISNNQVRDNGRFGIEIKNPTGSGAPSGAGSIVVSENNVSRTVNATDLRDHAGILVIRRAPVAPLNADQPTGVVITGNTVTGYRRAPANSTGDGFGILVEGLNNVVSNNVVSNNDVGIQVQGGNTADIQSTDFFDRGNAAAGDAAVNRNSIAGNTIGLRTVGTTASAATPLNGICNWWGALSGPGSVGPGTGDPVSANVTFNPWLGSSDLAGPCAIPTVRFRVHSLTVNENIGQITIHVDLSEPSGQIVKVGYYTDDITATENADYQERSGTLTFNPGETSKSFTITIHNDTLDEFDEQFEIELHTPIFANLGIPNDLVVTIIDNDQPPAVRFHSPTYEVSEAVPSGLATINVSLSAASGKPITVTYTLTDGTALAGPDYVAATGKLRFNPGQTQQTFTVAVKNDTLDEHDETVNLALVNPINANLGSPATATLTILDDDPVPSVQFNPAAVSIDEAGGQVTFTATLSAPSGRVVTVPYATTGGTASAGDDYVSANGVLVFAPGQTSQSFAVTIVDDLLDEVDETVVVTLSTPTNAALGAASSATATILDNDEPPTIQFGELDPALLQVNEDVGDAIVTVKLSAPSGKEVRVSYATSNGTAEAGSDYVAGSGDLIIPAGAITGTFAVTILDDLAVEANETINLQLSAPINANLGTASTTLTIIDNDSGPLVNFSVAAVTVSESAGFATINVKLSTPAPNQITVAYGTSDGTATAGQDYTTTTGTLTFAVGEESKSFVVPILDDAQVEDGEVFTLALSDVVGAILGAPAKSVVTILDDDGALPTAQFGQSLYIANANGGSATITVVLDQPAAAPVTVDYSASGGTAQAGVHYEAANGTLTFAAGQTSQSFVVPIIDNGNTDDVSVGLTLSNPNGLTLGTRQSATLIIVGIGGSPLVEFQSENVQVLEGNPDGLATFTVILDRAWPHPVSVKVATSNGTATAGEDYLAKGDFLTFAPGQTSQTFTISILDDAVEEAHETVLLTLSEPTNARLGARQNGVLTIVDDDGANAGPGTGPAAQFALATFEVAENVAAGVATITVRLDNPTSEVVTIAYNVSSGTAQAGVDFTASSGVLTFAPGQTSQTFTVQIIDDSLSEDDETILLTLSAPINANLSGTGQATLVIVDNDARPTLRFGSASYTITENAGEAEITVLLSSAAGNEVSVQVVSSDTAVASATSETRVLTFAPGQTSQVFTVAIADDEAWGENREISFSLQSPVNATLGTPSTTVLKILEDDPEDITPRWGGSLFLPLVAR